MGQAMKSALPHSHYPPKGGRWIAIACTNDKIFARLAELMGMPAASGEGKCGTFPKRDSDRAAVDAAVTHWTISLDRNEALGKCEAAQVPCGAVYGVDEICGGPQYRAPKNICLSRIPVLVLRSRFRTPFRVSAPYPAALMLSVQRSAPTTGKSTKSCSACWHVRSAHWRKLGSSDRCY